MKQTVLLLVCALANVPVDAADKSIPVTLLARQIMTYDFQGQVPGWSSGQTTGQGTCTVGGVVVACQGGTQSTGTAMPPRATRSQVTGAILVVQAPDLRIAVVQCTSNTT
jgi:hypothetical protein